MQEDVRRKGKYLIALGLADDGTSRLTLLQPTKPVASAVLGCGDCSSAHTNIDTCSSPTHTIGRSEIGVQAAVLGRRNTRLPWHLFAGGTRGPLALASVRLASIDLAPLICESCPCDRVHRQVLVSSTVPLAPVSPRRLERGTCHPEVESKARYHMTSRL